MTGPRDLVAQQRVIACVGSGGVGKTTLSAALALGAARRGQRAVVLTIDPARRLADALGVELGAEPTPLPAAAHERLGIADQSFWALMLDTKRTFDQLVDRFARDEATRDRILANEIYQHVSDALAGSSEYSAMEKVYELATCGSFDLIVLDTPPSQHALDFLEAPERLLGLIDSQIARRFLHPAMSAGRLGLRLLHRGTEPLFRALERITGLGFLEDLSEFLLIFEEMSGGFRKRAEEVRTLLYGPETAFVLASGPAHGQVRQALSMAERLGDMGVRVRGVILNRLRAWPEHVTGGPVGDAGWTQLASALVTSGLAPSDAALATDTARAAYESYDAWVRRDREATVPLVGRADDLGAFVRRVPELPQDVHDLGTLNQIEARIFAEARAQEFAGGSSDGRQR